MSRPLTPPRKTRYLLYRKLGGPQGRYVWVQKISPRPGFKPSRYTGLLWWIRVLNQALYHEQVWGSDQLHTLASLATGERISSHHWIGHWVGSRASLDRVTNRKYFCPWQEMSHSSIPVSKFYLHKPLWLHTEYAKQKSALSILVYKKYDICHCPYTSAGKTVVSHPILQITSPMYHNRSMSHSVTTVFGM